MNLADHPTVKHFHESHGNLPADPPQPLDAAWLRQLCLDCGADDAGLVEINRPALGFDRERYRRRNVVERLVGWLKEYRRVFCASRKRRSITPA